MKFETIFSAAIAFAVVGCATPSQIFADAEVDRLCAIDGGVKVHEIVKLPRAQFNQWGQIKFYRPTQGELALGPEYQLITNRTYYRKASPEMSRLHIQVFRKSDQKLLGESVSYGRGGGDIPGPWHDSSYHCPSAEYGYIDLFSKIFVVDGGENK